MDIPSDLWVSTTNSQEKKEPGKYSQTIDCLYYCTLYAMRFF